MDLEQILADLSQRSNIPGRESELAQWLQQAWAGWVDEARVDAMGNYIGLRRGRQPGPADTTPAPRPLVLAAAHLDSIGLMITRVEAGGFLRVEPVGGVDRRVMLGQEVELHTRDGVLNGLIGTWPPHLTEREERKRAPKVADLFVDTGLPEATVRARVSPGDPVVFRRGLRPLLNGRMAGRYLDNRAGVAALAVALAELSNQGRTALDFCAVGTVGEEFGGFPGAVTAAWTLRPAVAITVDVTFGAHPDATADSFPLDGGPTVLMGPNANPGLARYMRAAAAEQGIPVRVEVAPEHSGTDAWGLQVQQTGAAAGVLSIPLRYMHTPVETVALEDIRRTGRLLAAVVAGMDERLVAEWTWRC